MPPSKPKPSEIAAEAKKTYIPYIRSTFQSEWPATSFLCYSESMIAQPPPKETAQHCRFGKGPTFKSYSHVPSTYTLIAFYERDPVDLALDWMVPGGEQIPVIMPANDKRPGGDWEAGM